MKNRIYSIVLLFTLSFIGIISHAQENARIMRFPDINNDLVVFVYAGDIWSASSEGGTATRLTSQPGLELFPKISPDGKWVAFSGEFSGNRQVYVIPSTGGTPEQLTWYNSVGEMPPRGGWDNVVLDWTSDSKHILARMNRTAFGQRNGRYFLIPIEGGQEEALAIHEGGFGVLSPDDDKICFAPIAREFRTWKRYKGGRASDLWIYDLKKDEAEQITSFNGSDQIPTWYKNNIYYASDKDLRLNIHKYDITTKTHKQLSFHKDFDVMWPSGENGKIVYEVGGKLFQMDLESETEKEIKVQIFFDNTNLLPYYKKVDKFIGGMSVSPSAKRVLFEARGDIFSVPAENGTTYNLTKTQGVREIAPTWSPDGKYISYYSEISGEYEIYLLENKKGASPKQITKGSSHWKYGAKWSPDSKYLLYFDRSLKLKLLDVESGKETIVFTANRSEIRSYSFSPDSKWIAFSHDSKNRQTAIWVYNIDNKKNHQLTDNTFGDYSPVFSKDGKYIFFLSNRDFNLKFSSFEFNYIYDKATRIYAIHLQADGNKLFPYKNDIEEGKAEKKEEKTKDKKDENEVKIDFEGIENRISAIPLPSGNYRVIEPVDGGFLYISKGSLHRYKLDKKESEEIMSGVYTFRLTPDGKSMLYRYAKGYGISKLSPKQKAGKGKLNLDGLEMKIDPVKEWNQIFNDGWRIFRDYFYVANMHGTDWKRIRDNYAQLIPYLSHRTDLDYVLGEMIAETNTGHAYVNYGDHPKVEKMNNGLLGAEFSADTKKGLYRIEKIYSGESWNNKGRSPLAEPGIDVSVGDYIISINGVEVTTDHNLYYYLENCYEKSIEIILSSDGKMDNAETYVIDPIASEMHLRYLDWVNERRKRVDELSDGRIGYIHVPNTAHEGNIELFKGMYAYHNKEALIIDDRNNGGGFIPDVMADLLDRDILSYWHRNGFEPNKTPGIAHDGPKVMLINHYSSSGGDAFPYYFRKKGLGTIIGTRTWGGLVGISGNAGLVDGGYIAVPRFGVFDENEEWIVEGIGIYPDIEVVDAPDLLVQGKDPSLEKAIEVLMEKLEKQKIKFIEPPDEPNRSEWIEEEIK